MCNRKSGAGIDWLLVALMEAITTGRIRDLRHTAGIFRIRKATKWKVSMHSNITLQEDVWLTTATFDFSKS